MPELPKVNAFQRCFDETALPQRILAVEVQDDKIIRNVSGMDFIERNAYYKEYQKTGFGSGVKKEAQPPKAKVW